MLTFPWFVVCEIEGNGVEILHHYPFSLFFIACLANYPVLATTRATKTLMSCCCYFHFQFNPVIRLASLAFLVVPYSFSSVLCHKGTSMRVGENGGNEVQRAQCLGALWIVVPYMYMLLDKPCWEIAIPTKQSIILNFTCFCFGRP
jgi:hypothetical protein